MKFRILPIALLCALTIACSKSIEGSYIASNAKAGTFRFDANGKVTFMDADGKKLYTRPYSIKERTITIYSAEPRQSFNQVDGQHLETKDTDGNTVIYKRR